MWFIADKNRPWYTEDLVLSFARNLLTRLVIILCFQQRFLDALCQGIGIPGLTILDLNTADHLFGAAQTLAKEDPLFSQ